MQRYKGTLRILGTNLGKPEDVNHNDAYADLLEKMAATLNKWKHRKMSIAGKIMIIKTLITPKLVYTMSNLKSPYPSFWSKVNNILFSFISDG